MGHRLVLLALCAAALGACGKEIGDACVTDSDCSPNGDRQCLCSYCQSTIEVADEGYCTVQGCDFSTCPDEAVCVRFFTGDFDNRTCDPTVAQADCAPGGAVGCCSLDELCAINGHCVPRASEVRYCMRTCGSDGDCRDGYECRDFAKMQDHGGQPLLAPGVPVTAQTAPKFCAATPP